MSERLLHEESKSLDRAAAMEADFLAGVAMLRGELHIRPAKGGTRDRLRIALAVADAYLHTIGAHARWDDVGGGRQVPLVLGEAKIVLRTPPAGSTLPDYDETPSTAEAVLVRLPGVSCQLPPRDVLHPLRGFGH